MIILDTNVVSALMKPEANGLVVAWLDWQAAVSVWITTITVFEIRFGLMSLPNGRRRQGLERAFTHIIREELETRVLAFDAAAADEAASLAAAYRLAGQPSDVRDIQIAGIAISRKAVLATRNAKHFRGPSISLVDPWQT
jgi:predicted nucleic acid-binding protein